MTVCSTTGSMAFIACPDLFDDHGSFLENYKESWNNELFFRQD